MKKNDDDGFLVSVVPCDWAADCYKKISVKGGFGTGIISVNNIGEECILYLFKVWSLLYSTIT